MKPVKHRPKVLAASEETNEGSAWVYRVRCSPDCGTRFDGRFAKKAAERDRLEHLTELAPPVAERCRDPQRHRCQNHDYCPLCAGQTVLPGFEEIA